ncbi:hypothetical protein [Halocalculus aciditolerans]|uniref:hypothetical protein n=1 Tax=Halocalculus aciditolerans TaxID=1383812 RepID=UPI0016682BCE|nr:hypothetical protein [Halocalculus aciditolerans]
MADVYERSTADSQTHRSFGDDPLDALVDRLGNAGFFEKAGAALLVTAALGLAVGSLAGGLLAFTGSLAFVFAVTAAVAGVVVAAGVYARRALGVAAREARRRIAHD